MMQRHYVSGREFPDRDFSRLGALNRRARTPNIQPPTSKAPRLRHYWMLGVRCWMLDVSEVHGQKHGRSGVERTSACRGRRLRTGWEGVDFDSLVGAYHHLAGDSRVEQQLLPLLG